MRSSAASTSAAVPASIGSDGPADLEPDPAQPLDPVGERGLGRGRQVAAEHRRAADVRDRDGGGPGDRLGHDAGQRALAQVAEDQRDEELLLGRGRAAEEALDLLETRASRSRPGERGQALEGGVDLPDGEGGLVGGRGEGRGAPPSPRRSDAGAARPRGTRRRRPTRRGRGRAGSPPGGRSWPCATRFRARTARRRRAGRAACRGRVASPCRVPAP